MRWIETHGAAWEANHHGTFALVEDNTLVGAVTLTFALPNRRAELGYWVGLPYWRRGFATEAGRRLLAWGFGELGLHRIQAHHLMRNPASGRVLEKLGMSCEGIHRDWLLKSDRFEDVQAWAILEDEWRAQT